MLIYGGVDEAGYGPLLGPLCIGVAVFALRDADPADGAPDLWRKLEAAVCRRRRDGRGRIAVDDSKKLKGSRHAATVHPLRHLERAVLAFAALAGAGEQRRDPPVDDAALLARLGAAVADCPWYDSVTPLPVGQSAEAARIDAGRLRRAMAAAGARCRGLGCEVIDAGTLNRSAAHPGNKAAVNLGAALRAVERIWRRFPRAHPRVVVDRQGGRRHYRQELRAAWPRARVGIVAEGPGLCRYRLDRAGSPLTLSFLAESESRHLPVALASMTAKYVRELLMIRMNRFFRGHLPALADTAGYVTDGRRYLGEIEPVVRRLGLPRQSLVRSV